MAKKLSKILWHDTKVDGAGKPVLPSVATDDKGLNGLLPGELFMHVGKEKVSLWALSLSGEVVEVSGKTDEVDIDFSDYLLKSVWDSVFEIKTDVSGQKYIFGKLPVVTKYGITMYTDDGNVDIPQLAEGLPYDQRTIWFNPETKQIEVIGGTGGGVADSVLWDNVEGKPSWITSTKPKYSYSEIEGTPDLSGYATTSSLNAVSTKLNDFLEGSDTDTVINKWKELETFLSGLTESDNLATILTGKADKSYVDTNFVTIAGTEDVTGLHNFVNGLKIGGLPITKKQDDVIYIDANVVVRGGITMYGDGEGGSSVPSYSTLGSLLNVDESNDAVASVDRVLFQSAGSNVWSWKALSEIGGGSSGGSISGTVRYLSTLGSTGSWYDSTYRLYGEWGLHDRLYLKTEGGYDVVANLAEKDGNGNVIASTYLPLSGGTLDGKLIVKTSLDYPFTIFRNTSAASYLAFENKDGYLGDLGFLKDGTFYVYTNGVNERILHSGNISSYNAGSATKLQTARTIWGKAFDGTADITAGDITAYASSDDTTSLNLFKASGDVGWQLSGRYGNDLGLKIYYYDKSSWNNYLRIYTNGNVEVYQSLTIGSPYIGNGNLRVGGRSYFGDWVYLFDNSSNTSNNNSSRLYFAASGYDKGVFLQGINVASYGRKRLGVFVNNEASYNATAWNEALSVLPDGNVGIGNTSPAYKLDVNGTIRFASKTIWGQSFDGTGNVSGDIYLNNSNFIRVADTSGTSRKILTLDDGNNVVLGYHTADASYDTYIDGLNIHIRSGKHNEVIHINSSGNVGIGTASPSTKLHVNGGLTCKNIIVDMESDKNASVNLRGTTTDLWQISARYGADKGTLKFYNYNGSTWAQTVAVTSAGNVTVLGGITMYSDQRKKTILNHVELSLKQIADAPLIEHYYNSDQEKTTHVGSIAQYWAGINDWFCKLDAEGYYTMEIQNCALASAISIARHLERYESKTDKQIRKMKQRIKELEDEVERLKQN